MSNFSSTSDGNRAARSALEDDNTFSMQQTYVRTRRSECSPLLSRGSRKGSRTSRTINALGVDAIQRSAGRVVAVGAASRRTNRDSSAIQNADGLRVGVGPSVSNGHDGSENESKAQNLHSGQVQGRVAEPGQLPAMGSEISFNCECFSMRFSR